MICGHCNQRYGTEGKNYYSIEIGVCPKCKKIEEKK
jgi:Zn-finger nucleic acid-binding protein